MIGIGVVVLAIIGGIIFAVTRPSSTVGGTPASTVPSVASSTPRASTTASSAAPSSARPSTASASAKPSSAAPSASKASGSASSTLGPKRTDAATVAADGTISNPVFSTKQPAGWKLSSSSGYKSRPMELIDTHNNLISLFDSDRGDPATACQLWADDLKNEGTDKVETLPASTWGGLPATTMRITTHNVDANDDEVYVVTCAKKGTIVYVLASVAWTDQVDSVKAAGDAVKAAWVWK
jgi:cytoskeletal protein RodZ